MTTNIVPIHEQKGFRSVSDPWKEGDQGGVACKCGGYFFILAQDKNSHHVLRCTSCYNELEELTWDDVEK